MQHRHLAFAVLLGLTACGGGGGGGPTVPPQPPNEAPVLIVPTGLSGGPVQFSLQLPTGGSQTLVFNATDADGDTLLWQVAAAAGASPATGLVFTSPTAGMSFTLALQPVTAAASASINILVEDPRGAAASIDLLVVRSGSPTITSVSPDSAFATARQRVTVSGTAFSLSNSITTTASFAGLLGTTTVVVDENTLICDTPAAGVLGSNAVAVSNQFGSASLSPAAFTMYAYPVAWSATDSALDGGAGAQLAAANDGKVIHVVFVEGGALQHRSSTDSGATFSSSMAPPLSGGETPSEPRVVVDGDDVTVVWIGDGSTVLARSSTDAGASFAPAVTLNPLAGGAPAQQPLLVHSGQRRYCAWLAGNSGLAQQRVIVSSSANAGSTWTAAASVSGSNANQTDHTIGCEGVRAWCAFVDNPTSPTPTGPGVYSSFTTDGGIAWTAGIRRSVASATAAAVRSCNDGLKTYLVWVRDGALEYMVSQNGGALWPTQATLLRAPDLGMITAPAVACEGDRLFAAYVAGTNNLAFSRVGAVGASPQHVTVSDASEAVGRPSLRVRGNYALLAWQGGTGGAQRIRHSSSTDIGLTFRPQSGLGDGTAQQDEPVLLLDGARLWLGWQDARGAMPAIFSNRTQM